MARGHTVCSIQDGWNLQAKRAGHRKQKSVTEEILNFLDVGRLLMVAKLNKIVKISIAEYFNSFRRLL